MSLGELFYFLINISNFYIISLTTHARKNINSSFEKIYP
jgi:hypothetical protein